MPRMPTSVAMWLDALDVAAAHDHQCILVGRMGEPLLAHVDDLAVVGRDQAGGPEQVGLAGSAKAHFRRVVGVAQWVQWKSNPSGPVGTMWRVLSEFWFCCSTTLGNTVIMPTVSSPEYSFTTLDDARIGKPDVAAEGAHFGGDVVDLLPAGAADQDAVAAGRVDLGGRFLVGAEQAEGDEEDVQQGGVIRVLDILLHQLPVAGNMLAIVAEHRQFSPVIDAGVVLPEPLPKVFAEWRRVVGEGRPDQAVDDLHPQFAQAVMGRDRSRPACRPGRGRRGGTAAPCRSPRRL